MSLTLLELDPRYSPSVWLDSLEWTGPLVSETHPIPPDLYDLGIRWAGGTVPPVYLLDRLRTDAESVPGYAWNELAQRMEAVWVVHGISVTTVEGVREWAGRLTSDGRQYDNLPGVAGYTGVVIRLDGYVWGRTIPDLLDHEMKHRVFLTNDEAIATAPWPVRC